MKHLKNVIEGAAQALVLSPPVDYHYPEKSGPRKDARWLKRDASHVARDLKNNTKKYDK